MNKIKIQILFCLLLITVLCFSCQEQSGGGEFAKLYSVEITPNTAKVGDVIAYTYILDNVHYWKAIDYNQNVSLNADGQIQVDRSIYGESGVTVYTDLAYFGISLDEYGEYNSQNRDKHQQITKFKSIKEELTENGTKRKVTIECYVPKNAKSGYFELYSDIEWGREFVPLSKDVRYVPFTVKTN